MTENNMDVADSLRLTENFKVQMLKNAAEICEILMNCTDEDFYGRMCDCTADMLINVYVLANSAGIPFRATENNLRRKLRLYLLDNNDSDILKTCLTSLAKYALE